MKGSRDQMKRNKSFKKLIIKSLLKQKSILPHNTGTLAAVAFSIVVLLNLSGCEDSGSVGGAFPGSGTNVQVDTLALSELHVDTLSTISGGLSYFSVGRFQDPLFGDISATGVLRPVVSDSNGFYTFNENTTMQLKLAINRAAVYGDTLSAQQFDIVEVANVFRSNEVNYGDEIQTTGSTVGSFSITNQDTIRVDLADSWVQKYAAFYNDSTSTRDSTYVHEFPGLAIVPQNSANISPLSVAESKFLVSNLTVSENADSTVTDSLTLSFRDWGFTVDRTNAGQGDPASSIIHNTLERVYWFKYDFSSSNLGAENIANVKLVFYRDNALLEATSLGAGAVRRIDGNLRLHLVDGDELPQSVDPGSPYLLPRGITDRTTGFYQQEDGAYYIDITGPILGNELENVEAGDRFYLTFGLNDGTIRSSVIFNTLAGASASPKVIVTSTKTGDN